jgi:hypothetical protein
MLRSALARFGPTIMGRRLDMAREAMETRDPRRLAAARAEWREAAREKMALGAMMCNPFTAPMAPFYAASKMASNYRRLAPHSAPMHRPDYRAYGARRYGRLR